MRTNDMTTCMICKEVPASTGESFCEVCVKTLDKACEPGSSIEVATTPAEPTEVVFILPRPDGSPLGQVSLRRGKKAS